MKRSEMNEIIIPDEIICSIAEHEAAFCNNVKKTDPYQAAKNLKLSYKQPLDILHQLATLGTQNDLDENRILEIGSGNGFFLCYALKNGLDIVGIEPGKSFGFVNRYHNATKLLEMNGIMNPGDYLLDASSERLPFSDNTFDIVFSVAVLEHVQDVDQSIKESLRVLKPGGVLFASVPNYNSTLEEHYDIFWIPYMNKKIAKLYVSLLGRDPVFIDDLNFTNPSMFSKYLNSEYSFGSISLFGKAGGLYDKMKNIASIIDNTSTLDQSKPRPIHKAIIVKLMYFNVFSRFLKKIISVCLKSLQIIGSARIIHIFLHKR